MSNWINVSDDEDKYIQEKRLIELLKKLDKSVLLINQIGVGYSISLLLSDIGIPHTLVNTALPADFEKVPTLVYM